MSTQDQDQCHLFQALEAILLSPVTAQAVARTLLSQAAEREVRTMVSDLRARRAQTAHDQDADAREKTWTPGAAPSSPWAMSG